MKNILGGKNFSSILAWVCLAGPSLAVAQELPIGSATTVELHSRILDESREIWISTPAEYDLSQKPYPVLFLLDARWHFNHAIGTAEFLHNTQQVPPMIVVGIVSYNRSKDMLPANLSPEAERFGPNVGGADMFLEYIDKEVSAYVQKNYRASSYRMLAGHSLGGLTVLHALKTKRRRFNLYHALSPSLHYLGDGYLSDWIEKVASGPHASQALFVSVGSEEQQLAAAINDTLATPLNEKKPKDLSVDVSVVPGNHSTMVHGAIADALAKHFSDWTLNAAQAAYQRSAYPGLREHLVGVRKRYPFDTDQVTNRKMFRVAENTFLAQGVDPAMELLKSYVNDSPDQVSPLIHEAIGQGYHLKGQREQAVVVMKDVYEMNPGSELAVSVLSQADHGVDTNLPPDPLPPDELEQYAGTYALKNNPILKVFVRDGELWVRHRGSIPDRLRWLGEENFFALGSERIHYQFQENASGTVVGVERGSALGLVQTTKQ